MCAWMEVFFALLTLQEPWLHHLPNGYYIHITYEGREAEMTFLLVWSVVYVRAEGSSMEASDPYGPLWTCYFSVKAETDSRYSYIRL